MDWFKKNLNQWVKLNYNINYTTCSSAVGVEVRLFFANFLLKACSPLTDRFTNQSAPIFKVLIGNIFGFFSQHSFFQQRSALSIAANCCHSIGVGDFHLVADSVLILSGRLQHQVSKNCDDEVTLVFFYP